MGGRNKMFYCGIGKTEDGFETSVINDTGEIILQYFFKDDDTFDTSFHELEEFNSNNMQVGIESTNLDFGYMFSMFLIVKAIVPKCFSIKQIEKVSVSTPHLNDNSYRIATGLRTGELFEEDGASLALRSNIMSIIEFTYRLALPNKGQRHQILKMLMKATEILDETKRDDEIVTGKAK